MPVLFNSVSINVKVLWWELQHRLIYVRSNHFLVTADCHLKCLHLILSLPCHMFLYIHMKEGAYTLLMTGIHISLFN